MHIYLSGIFFCLSVNRNVNFFFKYDFKVSIWVFTKCFYIDTSKV